MELIIVIFMGSLFPSISIAQKTGKVVNRVNWKDVIIMEMDTIDGFPNYLDSCSGGGEFVIETRKNIKRIEDISKSELQEIKKFVAEVNGRIVYLDIQNKIYTQEKGIYFIWSRCLPEKK